MARRQTGGFYARPKRRSTFRSRQAVTRSDIPMPKTKSRRKCAVCKTHLSVGESIVRLRLKKQYQMPCSTCGTKPGKLKFFHPTCCPSDINKAMGYDANAGQQTPADVPTHHSVPPPPKPPTAEEALVTSIAGLENALILKLRATPAAWELRDGKRKLKPEIEKAFETFQGIKARVLRGSTEGEIHAATSLALQRVIKLVFAL